MLLSKGKINITIIISSSSVGWCWGTWCLLPLGGCQHPRLHWVQMGCVHAQATQGGWRCVTCCLFGMSAHACTVATRHKAVRRVLRVWAGMSESCLLH